MANVLSYPRSLDGDQRPGEASSFAAKCARSAGTLRSALAEVDALHVAVDPTAELRRRRAARKLADVDQPVALGAARDEDAKLLDADDDARQRRARRQRVERRSRRAAAAG